MQDLWTDKQVRDALVGKTIRSVALNEDNTEITFVTDTEPVTLVARGDCCSQCWIESLDDPEALLGTVTAYQLLAGSPAINAGVRSGMVRTGYGRKHEAILWTQPDVIEDDLGAVSERVMAMLA